MIRTFIAVEVSPEVKRRAREWIEALQRAAIQARWVDPESMHITLQFLGNVQAELIPQICQHVAAAVKPLEAFDVTCTDLGAFPSWHRPRVLWLGIGSGYEELVALQSSVEQSLKSLGYRGETRRFEPHLTLGRLRTPTAIPDATLARIRQAFAARSAVSFDVSEVVVFSSQLTRQGPIYEAMGRAELGG
jgi:2'-5' RNA ligase